MTYSHTQIAQYLRCPKSYRYRYLDGWREKENRASLLFGRCFEKALVAFFSREDSAAALFKEWGAYRDAPLEYKNGENWERLARQGVQLLERLAQDDRICIRQPRRNMQVKLVRSLSNGNDFVAYIDAVGNLDGKPLSPGVEDDQRSLSGGARGAIGPGSAADLLFLGQRDLRCRCRGLRAQADFRDSVPEDHDHRPTAAGVRPIGGSHRQPDRSRPVSPAQRHSLPAERLRELCPVGPLLGRRAAGRCQTHPPARS